MAGPKLEMIPTWSSVLRCLIMESICVVATISNQHDAYELY